MTGVQRDSSADEAAALMRRPLEGEADPPLTISGVDAASARAKLRKLYALLERLEHRSKVYREKDELRSARIDLGVVVALLPEPKR
jgi:hypothetical protein